MKHRISAILLGAASLLVASRASGQTALGVRYTFTFSGDGTDPVSGTTWAAGTRSRIDIDGQSDPQYVLVDNAAHTVILVYPRRQEYAVVSDTTFQRLVGTVLASLPVVNITLSDAQVSDTTLGAGETVAGHPTDRYQVTQAFTVSVGAFGFQAVGMRQRVTTQYWLARDLKLPSNPLVTLLSQLTTVLAQSDRDFAHRSAIALRPVTRGTPLRVVVHSETKSGDKNEVTQKTQTLQVTSIAPATVDLSRFAVPAGYTQKDPQFTGKIF
ncbi:MAG TPA: hypothetical protein VH113_06120 [Gemmatimonadales bacterium]|jgi:hypothetical protein|nr:hypothetical protein [Gemmatimonadales bacterium]